MALRRLEPVEKEILCSHIKTLKQMNKKAQEEDIEANSYDWRQLAIKLNEAVQLYKIILNKVNLK